MSPSPLSTSRQIVGLVGWLLLAFAAAGVGGLASAQAGTFYAGLSRPDWAPPGWLFGPVWSVLYILMGVSAWLVWRAKGLAGARGALAVFVAQLAANALWTWLFFVWNRGALAFVEILLLWVLIVITMVLFWRVSRLAVGLLAPYLAWVSFATALSYSIWQRNPGVLG